MKVGKDKENISGNHCIKSQWRLEPTVLEEVKYHQSSSLEQGKNSEK